MNGLQKLSLVVGVVGLGLLLGAFLLPSGAPATSLWLAGSGGGALLVAWLLLWKRTTTITGAEELEQLRRELERQATRLEKDRIAYRRERALHFGQDHIVDGLTDGDEDDDDDDDGALVVQGPAEVTDWDELDGKVLTLMRKESERLFGNLVANVYVRDGEFDRSRLGDDLIQLMESVAMIYRPESEHPLLETSVEKLLYAVNHASVQMLVHLQQLPLDVKSYNLRETYQYIRSGAKFYGYYKRVEPYWNYARPLYHLGRLAMGTNPVTIGVGWAVSELIKQGGVNYAHSYALRMFHDTVRILGNEAAGIFGADYRHRDPAWIYGLEMVGLTQAVLSNQSRLEAALKEVAGLTLRSEYDRVFLYGCLSGRAKPLPERFQGKDFLALGERQHIARKIETFVKKQGIDQELSVLEKWKPKVESRLGVHLRIGSDELDPSAEQSVKNALRALASFLIQFKQMDTLEMKPHLFATNSAKSADESFLAEWWQSIVQEPPMLYEIPIMVSGSEQLRIFLDDLLELEAGHAPRHPESVDAIEETAGYFREDTGKWRTKLKDRYAMFLLGEVDVSHGAVKKFPSSAAPLLFGLLDEGEVVQFFFEDVRIMSGADESSDTLQNQEFVLCGTGKRLILIAIKPEGADLAWSCQQDQLTVTRKRGIVCDDCEIGGGRWLMDSYQAPMAILIKGKKLSSYEKRFAPLLSEQVTATESP